MRFYGSNALSDCQTNPVLPAVALETSPVGESSKHAAAGVVTYKTKVAVEHWPALDALASKSRGVLKRMLANRSETASKFYKEVLCVVAKSLSAKYQRNPKCAKITSIVMPICGDKGKQVKAEPYKPFSIKDSPEDMLAFLDAYEQCGTLAARLTHRRLFEAANDEAKRKLTSETLILWIAAGLLKREANSMLNYSRPNAEVSTQEEF